MGIDKEAVKIEATGRWIGLYQSFGMDVRTDGKHGPCPLCGGKDRFRLDRDGSGYICNQCGAGDGIKLVQRYRGVDFPEALKDISNQLGMVERRDVIVEPDINKARARMNDLWKHSSPITDKCLVAKYFAGRGMTIKPGAAAELSKNIRLAMFCYESQQKISQPAMVAMVKDPTGKPVCLHRTYLELDGTKSPIDSPKKLMTPTGELKGAAIRLIPANNGHVGVAEGIETAVACAIIHRVPTWATISSKLMEAFVPPEGIRVVTIFGDVDGNYTGQMSAYTLANRLVRDGYVVNVKFPDNAGDFAEILERKEPKHGD